MGMTLSFRGRLDSTADLREMQEYSREFSRDMQWAVEEVEPRPEHGLPGGLLLLPHFASDPLPLLVAEDGILRECIATQGGTEVRAGKDPMLSTQAAGPEAHREVCEFLEELRSRFVSNLEVDDESGWFASRDDAALAGALARGWAELTAGLKNQGLVPGARLQVAGLEVRIPSGAPSEAYAAISVEDRELLETLDAEFQRIHGGFGLDLISEDEGVANLDLVFEGGDEDDESLAGNAAAEAFVHGAGAVFGRMLIEILGGSWRPLEGESRGLVLEDLAGVGLRLDPFTVAYRRLAMGPAHGFHHHLVLLRQVADCLRSVL